MKTSTKIVTATVLSVGLIGGVAAFGGYCPKGDGHGYGHGYGDSQHRAERMVERIADKLDLSHDQITKLDTLKEDLLSLRTEMRENRGQHKQDLIALMMQPTLDQAKALTMLKEKTQTMEQRAPEMITAIANFSDSLTAEQKQELAETLEKRFHGRWNRKEASE